jgi:tRNA-binding EMAP/Myf-like protein
VNYSLFYNYNKDGDILLISLVNEQGNHSEKLSPDFEVIYRNKVVIGYRIFNFTKIVKIKANGLIVLPPNALIDAINSVLVKYGFTKLSYKNNSGFVIGEIISTHDRSDKSYIYLVDVKEKNIKVISGDKNLKPHQKIVIALSGTRLFDNDSVDNIISVRNVKCDGLICTLKDLGMEESDEVLVLADSAIAGSDFYHSEVK